MATRANESRRDWHPQWRRWQRRATGGTGLDPFLFNQTLNALTNVDNILDFSVVDDTILLSHLVFTALGSVGTLPAGEFFTGATAGDAGDRIRDRPKPGGGKPWPEAGSPERA